MLEGLQTIAVFAGLIAGIYWLSMRSVPHRGILLAAERLCMGAALCLLCSVLFVPLGMRIVNSPLAAFAGGCFGLPGTAFSALLSVWR